MQIINNFYKQSTVKTAKLQHPNVFQLPSNSFTYYSVSDSSFDVS